MVRDDELEKATLMSLAKDKQSQSNNEAEEYTSETQKSSGPA